MAGKVDLHGEVGTQQSQAYQVSLYMKAWSPHLIIDRKGLERRLRLV